MASRPSGKMLKSLPPDPARHQDSAITPSAAHKALFCREGYDGSAEAGANISQKSGCQLPSRLVRTCIRGMTTQLISQNPFPHYYWSPPVGERPKENAADFANLSA